MIALTGLCVCVCVSIALNLYKRQDNNNLFEKQDMKLIMKYT